MSAYFKIWWIALATKLALAATLPLSNDEAYYWLWGHHLQWSYFDHPAGVAVLFWLAQPLEWLREFGLGGAVRWPAVLMAHSTFLILRSYFGGKISEKSHTDILLILICSPFFGLGSIVATPDIPHVFTWMLGLLAFQRHSSRPTLASATMFGAALGIGFCAKYHMVLVLPLAIFALLSERNWRALTPKHLAAGLVSGLLTSAPVWGWNLSHDWVSFRFQLGHGLDSEARSTVQVAEQLGAYIGGQLAILSPLVLLYAWRKRESRAFSALHWFGWGPILFFLLTSSRSPVEANWPIAGHLSLLTLGVLNDSKHWAQRVMMSLWSVVSIAIIMQAFSPERPILNSDPTKLKTWEFVRYKALVPIAKENPDLFASSYQMAGALSFETGRTVAKLKGINRPDFFDLHPSGVPTTPTFTVAVESDWPWPEWISRSGYHIVSYESFDRFKLVHFARRQ